MRSAAAIALAFWAGPALAEPSPERQRALAEFVIQDCGSCHGLTMKGGLGSPLLPEKLAGYEVQDLSAVILDGIPGTPMPPWRPLLTEGEAAWIAARLKEGRIP